MTIILDTVHGSHLYGLSRPGSDRDTYRVVTGENKAYARQRMRGEDDALVIHLSRFQRSVRQGVPQALEALFSPLAILDPRWAPFLSGLRPGITEPRMTYRRTIRNFGLGNGGRTGAAAERTDPVKMRRHALRLCLNLDDLVRSGRFSPRLCPDEIQFVESNSQSGQEDFEAILTSSLELAQLGRLHLHTF